MRLFVADDYRSAIALRWPLGFAANGEMRRVNLAHDDANLLGFYIQGTNRGGGDFLDKRQLFLVATAAEKRDIDNGHGMNSNMGPQAPGDEG